MKKNYYFLVRMDKCILAIFLFLITNFTFGQASFPYYENFEGSGDKGWTMVSGTQPNKWFVGSAISHGGTRALYISNDTSGTTYNYNRNSSSTTHAYRDIAIPSGTTNAYITFDWRANGEANRDYFQVWLVPASYTPPAGTLITAGGGRIQLGGNYSGQNSFQYSSNSVNLSSFAGANMRVVFSWRNDNNRNGNQPPAAIDNFFVSKYCDPESTNYSSLYITEFQYVGVLNSPSANIQTSSTPWYSTGYQDYTGLSTVIADQPQNTALNIVAKTNGTTGGSWKAWVDWNRDGDFEDTGEEVYNMVSFVTPSVTFGFVIPATAPVGPYRLRIGTSTNTSNFLPCSVLSAGEFEDYTFNVIADCSAKVTSVNTVNPFDGERCGDGSVRLSAKGTASAVSFKWYDYDPATKVYTYKATGITYDTPSIAKGTSHTYYVKAITNLDELAGDYCETPFYYPVEARADPEPTVAFSTDKPAICGEDDSSLLVTAAGDRFQDVIFEKFDSNLGQFNGNVTDAESIYTNAKAEWLDKPTPYIPLVADGYEGLSPAMSSGYFGGNFAMINSDIDRNTNIKYQLISNNSTNPNKLLNVNGYLNLQLDFDLYHFSIAKNNTQGYIEVSYTLDASVSSPVWVSLALPGYTVADASGAYPNRYWVDMGNPLKWQHFSITIPGSNFTSDKFAIRFIHFSSGDIGAGQKFYEAITAVDNVRLYGYKNITTPFVWSSATTTLYKSDCVTALGSTLESTVCVKPTATELEDVNWALNASATFSNGCPAIGDFIVSNDTKTWLQPGVTDWNLGAQWKPASVPTIAKCVIARTPVVLPTVSTGSHGLARSVIVKSGGALTVEPKSSLTIQNYIKNEGAASDVLVDSDANLVQNNKDAINIGDITVNRNANLKIKDYNYWGSPVDGAYKLQTFSPSTLATNFYTYDESTNFFIRVSSPSTTDFIIGKGYAIRAPSNYNSTPAVFNGQFIGKPNNGDITVPVVWTDTKHGYNLISNPYPSNIDFDEFYDTNKSLIYNTVYYWTNTNYNPKMQGSNYPKNLGNGTQIVNNYAVRNGTGGLGAPYGFNGTGVNTPVAITPNSFIKVGQGFIIKSKQAGNLVFENGMRVIDNSAIFFNRTSNPKNQRARSFTKDRFWMYLRTPLDFVTPLLVGYVNGATNGYDEDFDSNLMVMAGDSFYSILDNHNLAIQGKSSPLDTNDVVKLGASFGVQGQYEIAIEKKEGVFATSQNIYLKDNLTNTYTNLSEGSYKFMADAGSVTNRFEIHYVDRVLGVNPANESSLKIYQVGSNVKIDSPEAIVRLSVYDVSGRLLFQDNPNVKIFDFDASKYVSGLYYFTVETTNKKITKKIIKK